MKVLVTGGAGFIGSHTVVELQESGYDVVVLDNLSNASEKSLERVEAITGKKVPFYKADILDREALEEIFTKEEIGAVIHRDVWIGELLGKRFFLGHGDEVDYRSRLFRIVRSLFRNKFCQWLYAGIHPRWTFGFALGWSLNSRKSGLKHESSVYQGESEEYLVQFAKNYLQTDPNINFFIFGHRHIMLDLMLSRSSRILVAGDWMQHFSYIVWDGENLFLDQFEVEA